MPVTATDVARRAGVSQSAVSRVFTPGASVSPRMAAKVRKAAEELGYRPNRLARSLITGKSRVIGLLVAYLDNQFYPDAIERLSRALQARGYHVMVFLASNEAAEVDGVIEDLLSHQVDGLVMASVSISSDLAGRCADLGIPVVQFNRAQGDDRLSAVTSANLAGGREVARHLVACGHTRIAHISGWLGASTGQDRARGFAQGLEEAGQRLFAQIDGRYDRQAAQDAAVELFSAPAHARPDAVFVGNDHMAFAVMDVIRFELGLSIPDDVAVVGYDDSPIAAWPAYDLTTMRQPLGRMVEQTVDTLLDRIEQGDLAPRRVEIGGTLIRRGSTRPLQED
ncbi:LacI family DNA-binding transcriptional regulator [Roseobacter sp. HKCCA0434]|uniref:LacI family DNA-binding transcriptional regulator n=1 Tax=Roseobacter sp. HKCCA0434 TaxID=3079297 RepID=UPI002905946C|nr:LacI family DNA-binding transcriptional regulator [Roseobacter sp. HKCCA0434]